MIDTFNYLIYLQKQQALIYRSYEYYLQLNKIEKYLQRTYSAISLKIYKKLISYIQSLILQDLLKIIILITIISSLNYLKVIESFCYSIYNFLYKTLNNIKKYYKIHR